MHFHTNLDYTLFNINTYIKRSRLVSEGFKALKKNKKVKDDNFNSSPPAMRGGGGREKNVGGGGGGWLRKKVRQDEVRFLTDSSHLTSRKRDIPCAVPRVRSYMHRWREQ